MKKITTMRIASILLIAVLMTTCAISGTFAKYVTSATSTDSARVAKWGLGNASIEFENLFEAQYTNVTNGTDDMAIIAPGTSGSVSFTFASTGAPEVAYSFVVDTTGSDCADMIENNANITWSLDQRTGLTWTQLLAAIEALDGDKTYAAGELPEAFTDDSGADVQHTIGWAWEFETGDAANEEDTTMGDYAADGNELVVTLVVTITATQID